MHLRRFAGTINTHIPKKVNDAICKLTESGEMSKSEIVRGLLIDGLRARGIEC
jgi:hypothetical protein